jgi:hypothetical protein
MKPEFPSKLQDFNKHTGEARNSSRMYWHRSILTITDPYGGSWRLKRFFSCAINHVGKRASAVTSTQASLSAQASRAIHLAELAQDWPAWPKFVSTSVYPLGERNISHCQPYASAVIAHISSIKHNHPLDKLLPRIPSYRGENGASTTASSAAPSGIWRTTSLMLQGSWSGPQRQGQGQ